VLAILLGADAEAKNEREAAKKKAEEIVGEAKRKGASERETRLKAAKEQAKAIVYSARASAQAEAQQIEALGRQELERMESRFNENAPAIIQGFVAELVNKYLQKATGK